MCRLECEQEIQCCICIFCVFCYSYILENYTVYCIVYDDKMSVGEESSSILVKVQCHKFFDFRFFRNCIWPLIISLGPFQISSKIFKDIHSSRWTTNVNDNNGKWNYLNRTYYMFCFNTNCRQFTIINIFFCIQIKVIYRQSVTVVFVHHLHVSFNPLSGGPLVHPPSLVALGLIGPSRMDDIRRAMMILNSQLGPIKHRAAGWGPL